VLGERGEGEGRGPELMDTRAYSLPRKRSRYLRFCYHVRRVYCHLHPFIRARCRYGEDGRIIVYSPNRHQWIMRHASLISHGVPFFFEPWVNPDDLEYLPTDRSFVVALCQRFVHELVRTEWGKIAYRRALRQFSRAGYDLEWVKTWSYEDTIAGGQEVAKWH